MYCTVLPHTANLLLERKKIGPAKKNFTTPSSKSTVRGSRQQQGFVSNILSLSAQMRISRVTTLMWLPINPMNKPPTKYRDFASHLPFSPTRKTIGKKYGLLMQKLPSFFCCTLLNPSAWDAATDSGGGMSKWEEFSRKGKRSERKKKRRDDTGFPKRGPLKMTFVSWWHGCSHVGESRSA